jgi:hypothetical protein
MHAVSRVSYRLLSIPIQYCRDEAHEHKKGHNNIPETKNTEEGSAKRNITRKHDHDPKRCVPMESVVWWPYVSCNVLTFFSTLYIHATARKRSSMEAVEERENGTTWMMAR